ARPAPEIYALSLHDALPIFVADRPLAAWLMLLLDCFWTVQSPLLPSNVVRRSLRWLSRMHWMLKRPHLEAGRAGCCRNRPSWLRSEEHTSELQSLPNLVCRL